MAPFDERRLQARSAKALTPPRSRGLWRTRRKSWPTRCGLYPGAGGDQQPDVEHIQDLVERVLMDNGYSDRQGLHLSGTSVARLPRDEHQAHEDLRGHHLFRRQDSDIKRENANIDGDTAMGSMLKFGSEGAKQFYDMFVLNPDHARAHREGDIHIHDLDFLTLTTTCCQIDIQKLFAGGFSTGHGNLREPNDIASYAALAASPSRQSKRPARRPERGELRLRHGDGVKKTFVKLYRQNLARA